MCDDAYTESYGAKTVRTSRQAPQRDAISFVGCAGPRTVCTPAFCLLFGEFLRYRVRWAFCFAPYARVSFFSRQKRNQKGLPQPWPSAALRVPSLRRCSGGRRAGPSLAPRLSRLLPLNPLRNDSTRPALMGRANQDHKPDQEQHVDWVATLLRLLAHPLLHTRNGHQRRWPSHSGKGAMQLPLKNGRAAWRLCRFCR